MRVFVALTLPRPAIQALSQARAILEAEAPRLAWVGEENWHITLAFLGDQAEPGLGAARRGLHRLESQGLRAPLLSFGSLACFPPRGPWRVLVAGLYRPEGLGEVYTVLGRALAEEARLGGLPPLDPEWREPGRSRARPWTPHVTLARNRPQGLALPSRACLDRAGGILEAASGTGGWPLEAALLYKSELRPGGAVYAELDRAIFRPR